MDYTAEYLARRVEKCNVLFVFSECCVRLERQRCSGLGPRKSWDSSGPGCAGSWSYPVAVLPSKCTKCWEALTTFKRQRSSDLGFGVSWDCSILACTRSGRKNPAFSFKFS